MDAGGYGNKGDEGHVYTFVNHPTRCNCPYPSARNCISDCGGWLLALALALAACETLGVVVFRAALCLFAQTDTGAVGIVHLIRAGTCCPPTRWCKLEPCTEFFCALAHVT